MKKTFKPFFMLIPIVLSISNASLFSSCSWDKQYTTFLVQTNFNERIASLSNKNATLYTNFETIILFKNQKKLDLQNISVFVGDNQLINNVDFTCTYNSDCIDLFINGGCITQKNLKINLNVSMFEVSFFSTNNKAWISNNKVFLHQNFHSIIEIEKGQKFESIVIETPVKRLVEVDDYVLIHNPNTNSIDLSIYAEAITDIDLIITVTLSKSSFEVKILSSKHSGEVSLTNDYAFVGEDYSTIVQIKTATLIFDTIKIYNGSRNLTIDEEFTIDCRDNHAFLTIRGEAIVQNILLISIEFRETGGAYIPNSLLSIVPEWISQEKANKTCLYGIGKDDIPLDQYACLKIPDDVYEIKSSAFERKFNWPTKTNTNINKILISRFSRLVNIDKAAFRECDAFFSDIFLPEGLSMIGEEAFAYCKNISGNLVIPKSVEYIGKNAFKECLGISPTLIFNRNLNPSLPDIQEDAFNGCTGITILDLSSYDTFVPDWAKENIGAKNIFSSWSDDGIVYVHDDSWNWNGLYSCCGLPQTWKIVRR